MNLDQKLYRFISDAAFHPTPANCSAADNLLETFLSGSFFEKPQTIHIGSTRNGTAVADFPVFDFLIVVDREALICQNALNSLCNLCSARKISFERTSLGVVFQIRGTFFCLIPCSRTKVADEVVYSPDSTMQKIDVASHIHRMGLLDERTKNSIRLVKLWNHANGLPFESYHLDTAISRMTLTSLSWLYTIIEVFEQLHDGLATPLITSNGIRADGYLKDSDRQVLRSLCDEVRNIAKNAYLYSMLASKEEEHARAERAIAAIFGHASF